MTTSNGLITAIKKYIEKEDVLFKGKIEFFMTTAEPIEFYNKKGDWLIKKLEEVGNDHGDVLIGNMELGRMDGKLIN